MSHADFHDPDNPYAAPRSDYRPDAEFAGTLRPAPATVRFEIFGEAWELIRERMGAWVLLSLVVMAIAFGFSMAMNLVFQFSVEGIKASVHDDAVRLVVLFFVLFINQLINIALQSFYTAGLYRASLKQLRGEPFGVETLFEDLDVLPSVIWGQILYSLATMVGLVCCIIPGFYVMARLLLVVPLIVDGRQKPIKALELSWEALRGQTFMAFVFMLVSGLLWFVGILFCCIGLLFTFPFVCMPTAILYRDFFLMKGKPALEPSPWVDPA
jgi:uncharacterized membrane protein